MQAFVLESAPSHCDVLVSTRCSRNNLRFSTERRAGWPLRRLRSNLCSIVLARLLRSKLVIAPAAAAMVTLPTPP
jgi:hypothetical protein